MDGVKLFISDLCLSRQCLHHQPPPHTKDDQQQANQPHPGQPDDYWQHISSVLRFYSDL